MKRIVVKVGTHVISEYMRMAKLCEFLAELMQKYEVIFVTSGAIAVGVENSNVEKKGVINRQILAGIGQPFLMAKYNEILAKFGIKTAQILLTAQDFDSRKRTKHLNDLIDGLCEHKILPVINENDAVGIDEIIVGDNDRLSAYVAHFCGADMLVLLSDIDGYYTGDPKRDENAKIRPFVSEITAQEFEVNADAGTQFGTGGILTKLKAANFLLGNGKMMFLASGFDLGVAREFLLENRQTGGTLFKGN